MRGRERAKSGSDTGSIWDSFDQAPSSPPSSSEKKPQKVPSDCLKRIQPLIDELAIIENKIKNSASIEEVNRLLRANIAIRIKIKDASKEWFDSKYLTPEPIDQVLPDVYGAADKAYLRLTGNWPRVRTCILRWRTPPLDYLERIKPLVCELSAIEEQIKKAESIDEVERLLESGTNVAEKIARTVVYFNTALFNPRRPGRESPALFEAVNQAYIRLSGKERPNDPICYWYYLGGWLGELE